MSLRSKLFFGSILISILVAAGLSFALYFSVSQGFTALENGMVERNVKRISNSLENYFSFLKGKTGDWARWDATYEFVNNLNEEYRHENLVYDAFSTLDINFAIYINREGQPVYSYAIHPVHQREDTIDSSLRDEIVDFANELKKKSFGSSFSGYLLPPNSSTPPVLLVFYEIVKSDGSGPSNGMLVFGRYFDERLIQSIQKNTIFPLELRKIDDPTSSGFTAAKKMLSTANGEKRNFVILTPSQYGHSTPENYNQIEGYSLFQDIYGEDAFLIRIGIPRDIHTYSDTTLFYIFSALLVASILFVLFTLLFTERFVVKPLLTLTRFVKSVSNKNYVKMSVELPGSDELSYLASQVTQMLARLAKAQEALQVSEERYRGIVQSQTELIVRTDRKGIVLFVNDAFCQKFHKKKRELSGKTLRFEVYDQDKDIREKALKKIFKPPYRNMVEYRVTIENKLFWLSWEIAALRNSEGKIVEIQHIGRDITYTKTLDAVKSEFISTASHQLRTPLTGIRWFCELLLSGKSGDFSPQQRDFIDQIYLSCKRLISLVNNLLDVSHIESHTKFSIDKKSLHINEILKPVIAEQSVLSAMRHIEIRCNFQEYETVMLMADSAKIYQVFQNLINNAVKYSPNNSKIEVGMKREGATGIFYVKDFGLGIPQKQQGKIFEKFFRAENVLEVDTAGAGLGLYIVKAIIEGHGGKIWFESEEGKGTIFYFQLPIQQNL